MSSRKPYQFKTAQTKGPSLWRSLEEKEGTADLISKTDAPTAPGNGLVNPGSLLGRRSFLVASGVSAAALSMAGCIRRPEQNILPFSRAPEYIVPGVPLHFATVTERRGDAIGLLVTSHEGRPTKIEGNPEHSGSHGATDSSAQASVMDLYDPDRSVGPAQRGEDGLQTKSLAEFDQAFDERLERHVERRGAGLALLVRPSSSPTMQRLIGEVRTRLPEASIHHYASVNEDEIRAGAKLAFGQAVNTVYSLESANVILSIDSDFLGTEPGHTRMSRGFADGRRVRNGSRSMNRLYVVESNYSSTGASADHRLRVASRDAGRYLLALANTLASEHSIELGALGRLASTTSTDGFDNAWLSTVAADLVANRGRGAIVVGSRQPAWVHGVGHFLNYALGFSAPAGGTIAQVPAGGEVDGDSSLDSIGQLATAMRAGSVETLFILGGNPAYDAPAELDFAGLLRETGAYTVHFSSHRDATSELTRWHAPRTHELEAWGDVVALDGTLSVQQPLIAPMRYGRSDIEILARVAGHRGWRGHTQVRKTFRRREDATNWEASWRRALHRGVVAGTQAPPSRGTEVNLPAVAAAAVQGQRERSALGRGNFEVTFVPDSYLGDGTQANNPWLLEMPDPMTKIVWDNAALISVATAQELGVKSGDVLRLAKDSQTVEIATWVVPGHADFTVTLALGWGREHTGLYGNGHGTNVGPLRSSADFHFGDGFTVEPAGRTDELVQTQTHHSMVDDDGFSRPLAIDATFEKVEVPENHAYHGLPSYKEEPDFAQYRAVEFTNGPLWDEVDYSSGHRWGMSIDLTACSGCGACVIACQSENNIPTVGKREVKRGREMSWLRIDRYFVGEDMNNPIVARQPVGCQQCEEAPCENVCPVNATAHSPEGLNDMAYNRCVGTRYCANNCPYKVRRFNYLSWNETEDPHGYMPETVKMAQNPNVTVRMRGVMEKCTYCVQRIQAARIKTRREGRTIQDGDIRSACGQACATGAIVFGDLNDASSRVSQLVHQSQRYRLLEEVGTQPRTTYLGQIRNPNPAMFAGLQEETDGSAGAGEEASS